MAVPAPTTTPTLEQVALSGPAWATAAWFTVTATVLAAVQPWAVVAVRV